MYSICILFINRSQDAIDHNRSQHVMVDCCRSKLVNVVSGVPQGSGWACMCSPCTPRSFLHYGE